MRVLIDSLDLFHPERLRPSFYRRVVESTHGIDFYYFREHEPANALRPTHAHPIDYRPAYTTDPFTRHAQLDIPHRLLADFVEVNNRARSVSGMTFDAVDTPDDTRHGHWYRDALRRHGASTERVVLSLQANAAQVHASPIDRLHCGAVDVRYAVGSENNSRSVFKTHLLDLAWLIPPPRAREYRRSDGPPRLLFIGRAGKMDGAHLFVQMAWWLPEDSFLEAVLIGNSAEEADAHHKLAFELAQARRLKNDRVRIEHVATSSAFVENVAAKSVACTLASANAIDLAAIDALFAGCPVVISGGTAQILSSRFPDVPFVHFDLRQFYAQLPSVEGLLRDYDRHRDELIGALARTDRTPRTPPINEIYLGPQDCQPEPRRQCEQLDKRLGVALGN